MSGETEVKDRATPLNISTAVLALLTALAIAFTTSWYRSVAVDLLNIPAKELLPWPLIAGRIAIPVFAVATCIVAIAKARNENAIKRQLSRSTKSLSDQLEAERVRILSVMNGPLSLTAEAIGSLSAGDTATRETQAAAATQAIVGRALKLVANDSPRAAYYQVHGVTPHRTMEPKYKDADLRDDEFTTRFVEDSGKDSNVWRLIDDASGQAVLIADLNDGLPEGFTRTEAQKYRSYISAPVRVGERCFGMLTINTLEAGGLDERDRASMQLLARLLGVVETLRGA